MIEKNLSAIVEFVLICLFPSLKYTFFHLKAAVE